MAKQLTKFILIFFLATNIFAGGDDRDTALVESLDAVSNSTCTDEEGSAPCAEKVVSLDEEALTMALAAEEQAAEQAILDEIAAFEAELAAQQLADSLAAYQAKIDAERALAAKNLAAFQAKQAAEKEIAELAAKLAEELELDKQQAAKLAAKLSAELAAFEAYHSCKARLNLSDANIAKFKAAIAAGNLYNVGPQVSNGTDFSPRRWDSFFSCQEPTGS